MAVYKFKNQWVDKRLIKNCKRWKCWQILFKLSEVNNFATLSLLKIRARDSKISSEFHLIIITADRHFLP